MARRTRRRVIRKLRRKSNRRTKRGGAAIVAPTQAQRDLVYSQIADIRRGGTNFFLEGAFMNRNAFQQPNIITNGEIRAILDDFVGENTLTRTQANNNNFLYTISNNIIV